MWKGIDTIKTQLKGTPDSITGKGKVTAVIQKRLSDYYAQALKNNAADVAPMKRGVYASLFHMVSTDEDLHHHLYCPHGDTSWCHYNRALATGEPQRSHTPTMKRQHADKLKPVYERLTDDKLLKRQHADKLKPVYERLTDDKLLKRQHADKLKPVYERLTDDKLLKHQHADKLKPVYERLTDDKLLKRQHADKLKPVYERLTDNKLLKRQHADKLKPVYERLTDDKLLKRQHADKLKPVYERLTDDKLLKRQHADKLKPVYERLTDNKLLEHCTRMKTQNANEAFNGQVWRRCPKTEPTSLRVVETAVAII